MNELSLTQQTPVLVTPSKAATTIQNTMSTSDDDLMVSSHGDINKKWFLIESGDSVKFSEPTYLMQTGRASWVFPVIESD